MNHVNDGAARHLEKLKTTEEIHGCSQEGHAEDWCKGRRCYG